MDDLPLHPGSHHLLVLPDREAAEAIAGGLREEGFADVRVREIRPDGQGAAGSEWGVLVRDTRLPDTEGGGAYEGLRERFIALADEHGGWYHEPGDPRPPEPDLR